MQISRVLLGKLQKQVNEASGADDFFIGLVRGGVFLAYLRLAVGANSGDPRSLADEGSMAGLFAFVYKTKVTMQAVHVKVKGARQAGVGIRADVIQSAHEILLTLAAAGAGSKRVLVPDSLQLYEFFYLEAFANEARDGVILRWSQTLWWQRAILASLAEPHFGTIRIVSQ